MAAQRLRTILQRGRQAVDGWQYLRRIAAFDPVHRALFWLRRVRKSDDPFSRTHPLDVQYGVQTSGFLPAWLLWSGLPADAHSTAYAGCQPSCLRAALRSIPGLETARFLDLGCGLGRAMIVASEFPFAAIEGVELSPNLARCARRNIHAVAAQHAGRPAMTARQGDASQALLPPGRLVVFLYHSFGADLVAMVARRVAAHGRDGGETFFIYENPVHGAVLDAMPDFTRWFAAYVHCDPVERGFGPEDGEAVVVWRAGAVQALQPAADAGRQIVITKPGWRAELL
ncbi:MAG: class I SAM-dependent methyltransferase [Acetobacteraceae bacterium]